MVGGYVEAGGITDFSGAIVIQLNVRKLNAAGEEQHAVLKELTINYVQVPSSCEW